MRHHSDIPFAQVSPSTPYLVLAMGHAKVDQSAPTLLEV